jgi:hypothetical protein
LDEESGQVRIFGIEDRHHQVAPAGGHIIHIEFPPGILRGCSSFIRTVGEVGDIRRRDTGILLVKDVVEVVLDVA